MIRSANAASVPFRADVRLEAGLPSLSGRHGIAPELSTAALTQ